MQRSIMHPTAPLARRPVPVHSAFTTRISTIMTMHSTMLPWYEFILRFAVAVLAAALIG